MPIPLPNLDDRDYAALTKEAQALIPSLYPDWTNHNPTDPGIVLTELLAWLTEMTLFQLNQVPDQNIHTFLNLLGWAKDKNNSMDVDTFLGRLEEGKDTHAALRQGTETLRLVTGQAPGKAADLEAAVRDTVLALRRQYRAVTTRDFERLTRERWPQTKAARILGPGGRIRRVHCVAHRNLETTAPDVRNKRAPGHLSLVIIPEMPDPPDAYPGPSSALKQGLYDFFKQRRLLTTRHHIVGPDYIPVGVSAKLQLRQDAPPEAAVDRAVETLYTFSDPVQGGPEQTGWPFGRGVYVSEIYALLDAIPVVDHVENVGLSVADKYKSRLQVERDEKGAETIVGLSLDVHELVAINITNLEAIDIHGNSYRPGIIGVVGHSPLG